MHIPVLLEEVLHYLDPQSGENFIDCTIGGGGHSAVILGRNGPDGKLLGIEVDVELYRKLKVWMAEFSIHNSQFPNRLILVNDSYANLKSIVQKNNFKPVHGILLDLGMSSWHIEESGRGFSFLRDEPLDMRYNRADPSATADDIVNTWPEEKIAQILKEYSDERFAKRIAQKIAEERKIKPIKTTFQLVEIIKKSIPRIYSRQKIHPATRTFQALRIAVNNEFENLEKVLPQALEILEQKGRLVVISFHSQEDRIVKQFFKNHSSGIKILATKPVRASKEEILKNPRSRSAKLRVVIKI